MATVVQRSGDERQAAQVGSQAPGVRQQVESQSRAQLVAFQHQPCGRRSRSLKSVSQFLTQTQGIILQLFACVF